MCFFVKQKTAYEMRISDWSSDVCSSDLIEGVKTFPWVTRVSAGSWSFKLLENVTANLILTILVRKTGSDIFIGEGPWPHILSRSEERRVGNECVSTCISGGQPTHSKKNRQNITRPDRVNIQHK